MLINDGVLEDITLESTVHSLDLSDLNLREIKEEAFKKVPHLKSLYLPNNKLTSLLPNTFNELKKLEILSLANNNLTGLSSALSPLSSLKMLDLSHNSYLKAEKSSFAGLSDDTDVIVRNTSIQALSQSLFEMTSNEVFTTKEGFTTEDLYNEYLIVSGFLADDRILNKLNNTKCLDTDISRNPKPVMICKVNGIVQSVELATESLPAHCTNLPSPTADEKNYMGYELSIIDSGIKGFAKDWYRLPQESQITKLNIDFSVLSEINENMLNYLPPCIVKVELSLPGLLVLKANVMKNENILSIGLFSRFVNDKRALKIEKGAFEGLPNLLKADLGMNNIDDIEFVKGFPSTLEFLQLYDNNISNLPNGVFSHLTSLSRLDMTSNKISSINKNSLSGLGNLIYLSMADNALTKINSKCFDHLTNLRYLYLDENSIAKVENGFARNLGNLVYLNIRENALRTLERGLFYGIGLEGRVSVGNIEYFQPGIFKNY